MPIKANFRLPKYDTSVNRTLVMSFALAAYMLASQNERYDDTTVVNAIASTKPDKGTIIKFATSPMTDIFPKYNEENGSVPIDAAKDTETNPYMNFTALFSLIFSGINLRTEYILGYKYTIEVTAANDN